VERFIQKLVKSVGKYTNAQYLHQKFLKIARYSFEIFTTNLAYLCISEANIFNRTQVTRKLFKFIVLCTRAQMIDRELSLNKKQIEN